MRAVKRKLRRRFGISAPRMTVRTQVPWYWRWTLFGLAMALGLLFAQEIFDSGMRVAGFARNKTGEELVRLREAVKRLEKENVALRNAVVGGERQLQMERSAQADLTKSLKIQQDENARLQEDIAFFQTLMPRGKGQNQVTLPRLKVEAGGMPGEYRYRLLVMQEGTREKDFRGRVQLLANYVHDGEKGVLVVPAVGEHPSALELNFRYFQRINGSFQAPPGAVVKSVQARLFESGASYPRLQQTVILP
jgi:hypothetical protein